MNINAIGGVEFTSIAKGIESTDLMLKASDVTLLMSRSVCSGKYLVLIAGDVAAVESSVEEGKRCGAECVADLFIIPNLHHSIIPAISQATLSGPVGAIGVLEAFDVASLIEGTDSAVKSAEVKLLEVRLAMALGGKAFSVLTGDLAAVKAAVEAGSGVIGAKGLLVQSVIIPTPHEELIKELFGGRLI